MFQFKEAFQVREYFANLLFSVLNIFRQALKAVVESGLFYQASQRTTQYLCSLSQVTP